MRPCIGEAVVGHSTQEERLGIEHLVVLELVALLPALNLEHPAPVLEILRSARILHHAIQRNELGDNDPSHPLPPSSMIRYSTVRFSNLSDEYKSLRPVEPHVRSPRRPDSTRDPHAAQRRRCNGGRTRRAAAH